MADQASAISTQPVIKQHQPVEQSAWLGTLSGVLAILCWSPAALILSYLTHLPIMLVLAISFSICFAMVALKLTLTWQWASIVDTPWQCWLAGMLGIYGNNLCYLAALQYAPVAHVMLIGYLWPITILFLSYFFYHQPLTKKQLLASGIAFAGIAALILQGTDSTTLFPHVTIGYGFAFASSTLWATYCVVSQHYHQTRGEMVGIYCGIGALLSLMIYIATATPVTVTFAEVTLIIALGLTAFGSAFLFWDYGIKRGNFKFLCVCAFFIPVLATLLLILFGKAILSGALLFAVVCVTLGAYMARS